MARLPGGRLLIQQIGGAVILFEEGTEREIVRIDLVDEHGAVDTEAMSMAQKVISDSDLTEEDKAFAHFWCGYFYANAVRRAEMLR
jgi:hypothetical protein